MLDKVRFKVQLEISISLGKELIKSALGEENNVLTRWGKFWGGGGANIERGGEHFRLEG